MAIRIATKTSLALANCLYYKKNGIKKYWQFIEYLESHGVHRAIPLAVEDQVEQLMDDSLVKSAIKNSRLNEDFGKHEYGDLQDPITGIAQLKSYWMLEDWEEDSNGVLRNKTERNIRRQLKNPNKHNVYTVAKLYLLWQCEATEGIDKASYVNQSDLKFQWAVYYDKHIHSIVDKIYNKQVAQTLKLLNPEVA